MHLEDSLWKAKKDEFKTGEEIKLSWFNGKGLEFERKINVDDNFMISVEDEVINKSGKTVEITNFFLSQKKKL